MSNYIERQPQVQYVIRSLSESDIELDGDAGAFWSNVDGWGSFQAATLFSTKERMSLNLPMSAKLDAEWMLEEEARDLEANRNLLQNTKVFDFKINQQRHPDGSVPEAQMISVAMTQEQFEDHQTKRDFVHDGIRAIGLNPAEVVWFESPPIDEVTERAFKEHIGAAPDAQLIAYYPHSVHHRHYKEATLNGVKYLYMSFQNGHFIKFAQSVSNLNSEQAPA